MTPDTDEHPAPVDIDSTTWLKDYDDTLFRFALYRVSDEAVAEDLVQETFFCRDSVAGAISERLVRQDMVDRDSQETDHRPFPEQRARSLIQ